MRSTRAVEISTGLFVLLGFASLFFLVTQITNRELAISGGSYQVVAQFENVGSLKPGAAVSMAGVTVGRVDSITYDQQIYKAVVKLRISSAYNRIPTDSDAAIMTSGLLGGQYIGLTAGGSDEFLKEGDRITTVNNQGVKSAEDITKVIDQARKDGRSKALFQVETDDGIRFLALPIDQG